MGPLWVSLWVPSDSEHATILSFPAQVGRGGQPARYTPETASLSAIAPSISGKAFLPAALEPAGGTGGTGGTTRLQRDANPRYQRCPRQAGRAEPLTQRGGVGLRSGGGGRRRRARADPPPESGGRCGAGGRRIGAAAFCLFGAALRCAASRRAQHAVPSLPIDNRIGRFYRFALLLQRPPVPQRWAAVLPGGGRAARRGAARSSAAGPRAARSAFRAPSPFLVFPPLF